MFSPNQMLFGSGATISPAVSRTRRIRRTYSPAAEQVIKGTEREFVSMIRTNKAQIFQRSQFAQQEFLFKPK